MSLMLVVRLAVVVHTLVRALLWPKISKEYAQLSTLSMVIEIPSNRQFFMLRVTRKLML